MMSTNMFMSAFGDPLQGHKRPAHTVQDEGWKNYSAVVTATIGGGEIKERGSSSTYDDSVRNTPLTTDFWLLSWLSPS